MAVTSVKGPLAGVLGGTIVGGLVDTEGDLGDLLAVVELDALSGNVSGDDALSSNLRHDERGEWGCSGRKRKGIGMGG